MSRQQLKGSKVVGKPRACGLGILYETTHKHLIKCLVTSGMIVDQRFREPMDNKRTTVIIDDLQHSTFRSLFGGLGKARLASFVCR